MVCRLRIGKSRQRLECSAFVRPVQALASGIEHQDHPPCLRKRQSRDDRGRCGRAAASAVENQPAALEYADANAGAPAAAQANGVADHIERQIVEATNPCRDCECNLCPGTEAYMRRYRLLHPDRVSIAHTEMLPHCIEVALHTALLRALDVR